LHTITPTPNSSKSFQKPTSEAASRHSYFALLSRSAKIQRLKKASFSFVKRTFQKGGN
jgi:hypothetical protein